MSVEELSRYESSLTGFGPRCQRAAPKVAATARTPRMTATMIAIHAGSVSTEPKTLVIAEELAMIGRRDRFASRWAAASV